MNVALLVNPAARAGAHTGAATHAAERLRAHGVRTALVSGGSAQESSELLRAAIEAGVNAVVVAGGDGTVRLAIQEVAGHLLARAVGGLVRDLVRHVGEGEELAQDRDVVP